MKTEEVIRRYGEEAYKKKLAQARARYKEHPEEERARNKKYRKDHKEQVNARVKKWQEEHKEEVKAHHQEEGRKGGKYYDRHLKDQHTGLQGDKNRIRNKHQKEYKSYKDIIAPDSQIHHEWIPQTSDYRGLALVEKEAHQYGFVDVIAILDGEITLLTEEEVKAGGRKSEN